MWETSMNVKIARMVPLLKEPSERNIRVAGEEEGSLRNLCLMV